MSNSKTARAVFRDAVKDHGPDDPVLRLVLLLLADFLKRDGSCWATNKRLAHQSGLPERTLRERLQQLEGIWFNRERKPGRSYHYRLIDPGPGALIPTRSEVRKLCSHRCAPHSAATAAHPTLQPPRYDSAATSADPLQPPLRTRLNDTYKDVAHDGRPLAGGASSRRLPMNDLEAPPPGTVRCPECGSFHVETVACRFCARNPPQDTGVPIGDSVEVA